jgi:outer membrane protein OmpA-like peptidoglycan-associated protein
MLIGGSSLLIESGSELYEVKLSSLNLFSNPLRFAMIFNDDLLLLQESGDLKVIKNYHKTFSESSSISQVFVKESKTITFSQNSHKLSSGARYVLEKIAKTLKENPGFFIEIRGHTDDLNSERKTVKLSDKRANSVESYFLKLGISPFQIMNTVGFGNDEKLVGEKEKNFRAEIIIYKR